MACSTHPRASVITDQNDVKATAKQEAEDRLRVYDIKPRGDRLLPDKLKGAGRRGLRYRNTDTQCG
jgi:hypothetical protein